jgi:hypothetical protein
LFVAVPHVALLQAIPLSTQQEFAPAPPVLHGVAAAQVSAHCTV